MKTQQQGDPINRSYISFQLISPRKKLHRARLNNAHFHLHLSNLKKMTENLFSGQKLARILPVDHQKTNEAISRTFVTDRQTDGKALQDPLRIHIHILGCLL